MSLEIMWMSGAVIIMAVMLLPIVLIIRKKWKTEKVLPMDEMEGAEFEKYCARLLEKRGFIDVNITKASGDFGVDILAEKEGVTYAIQCKRYTDPVGVKAIQEAL